MPDYHYRLRIFTTYVHIVMIFEIEKIKVFLDLTIFYQKIFLFKIV